MKMSEKSMMRSRSGRLRRCVVWRERDWIRNRNEDFEYAEC